MAKFKKHHTSTDKPALSLYGKKGETWAARMTAVAILQSKGLVSPNDAVPGDKQSGYVDVGPVRLSVRNVMNQFGAVELEYKNKLEQELRQELSLRQQDPKILKKMDLGEMMALRDELKNTPVPKRPAPKLEPK